MKRLSVRLLLTVLLFTVCPAQAQQPTKVPQIGFLAGATHAAYSARIEAFR